MWHMTKCREKWLCCSRKWHIINVKGLLCIPKSRHRTMVANLGQLQHTLSRNGIAFVASSLLTHNLRILHWIIIVSHGDEPPIDDSEMPWKHRGAHSSCCSFCVSQRQVYHWESFPACNSIETLKLEEREKKHLHWKRENRTSPLDAGEAEVLI